MPQPTVSRLKELLFETEARAIDALAARVDALAETERRRLDELASRLDAVAAADGQARQQLQLQIEHLLGRAGDDQHLRVSVARIIDGSIRDAEVGRHRQLADALAPVVVRTVKAEIESPDTRDKIAGSLYTKIGEMVRNYVASAMRDLMEGINRRLESVFKQNGLILRLRSWTTGRSMAELALADTQQLDVEEIYLIRRGSGELIHRWQRATGDETLKGSANRDTLVSGFLTAITAFAEEAFEADKASLRSLDLDNHRIYLRGSPTHLVAAKCRGTAAAEIEAMLDAELIRVLDEHAVLERQSRAAADGEPVPPEVVAQANDAVLSGFANRVEVGVGERREQIRQSRGGLGPLKVMAWLIGLPLLAFIGWQTWIGYQTRTLQAAADDAVSNIAELKGYPVSIRVERGGQGMWAVGLTPTESAREKLRLSLKRQFPDVRITDTLGVVPQPDLTGALRLETMRSSLARADQRLKRLAAELGRVSSRLQADPLAAGAMREAETAVLQASGEIEALQRQGVTESSIAEIESRVESTIVRLEALEDRLAQLSGALPADQLTPTVPKARRDFERLTLISERVSQLSTVIEQTRLAALEQAKAIAPLQRQIADLNERLKGLKQDPTLRQRLEAFIREHAVFFSNGLEYRDARTAAAVLDELAPLVQRSGLYLRVVGYTDEAGNSLAGRNAQLSQSRAQAVLDELARRGVSRSRMIAVGRATALDLAPFSGATSTSRRVEFEIGFRGEEGALQ